MAFSLEEAPTFGRGSSHFGNRSRHVLPVSITGEGLAAMSKPLPRQMEGG
jgi:hypothetical protein